MVKVTIHGQRDDSEIHADTHNGHTWIEGADATSGAVLHVHIGQARQIATMLCRAFDFTAADLGIAEPVAAGKE
ncbi:MAG: hypothetical protein IMZ62_12970 [Chloroflexi bacterium]|nr:hypothetical protein [Chloroflexota bacterium]MBE3118190.1 hypothetical protein [Candidatus Atribacteria bacterium]